MLRHTFLTFYNIRQFILLHNAYITQGVNYAVAWNVEQYAMFELNVVTRNERNYMN